MEQAQYKCDQCGKLFDESYVHLVIAQAVGANKGLILCEDCANRLFPLWNHPPTRPESVAASELRRTAQVKFGLRLREYFILSDLVAGFSDKEIGDRLTLVDVEGHFEAIGRKVGASTREELIYFARSIVIDETL
jgi:DNA-binding NarL/FixJ family response regulator